MRKKGVFGLTGSIACGKSTILKIFTELGALCLDLDDVNHQLMTSSDSELYKKIVKEFGKEILSDNTNLIDKAKLRTIVFSNKEKLRKLESIAHPEIFKYEKNWIESESKIHPDKPIIIANPLLIELNRQKEYNKIIGVSCSPEVQLKRLMKRNNFDKETAQNIINHQIQSEEKAKHCDYIINNNSSKEELYAKCEEIYEKIKV